MPRYRVSGHRPVEGHEPRSEFERKLDSEVEAGHLAAGRLEVLPSSYRVVGESEVHGTEPGKTFEAALTGAQERALVEGGAIEPASKDASDEPAELPVDDEEHQGEASEPDAGERAERTKESRAGERHRKRPTTATSPPGGGKE